MSHFNQLPEVTGYTNHPTAIVALWLLNDGGFVGTLKALAADSFGNVSILAGWLQVWVENGDPKVANLPAPYDDLLEFAVGYVNWKEIAKEVLEKY